MTTTVTCQLLQYLKCSYKVFLNSRDINLVVHYVLTGSLISEVKIRFQKLSRLGIISRLDCISVIFHSKKIHEHINGRNKGGTDNCNIKKVTFLIFSFFYSDPS